MPILKVLENYISSKSDEQYILEYTNRYFIYENTTNIVKVIYKLKFTTQKLAFTEKKTPRK